ncbi:MAG: leucyl aminopeptidase [Gammaproteobacteria bacterium]|jgi:leucyl aminopeptidase|nr:leucyl aminopeptidase [Gammaproteobacteria bacterium]
MEFTVKNAPVAGQRSACIVVAVSGARRPGDSAAALDKAAGGTIVNVLKRGDMKPGAGNTLWLYDVKGVACERILLVDCGEDKELADTAFRKVVRGMATALRGAAVKDALCCLAEIPVRDRDTAWKVRQIVEATADTLYRFEHGPDKKETRGRLNRLHINVNDAADVRPAREAVRVGKAVNTGVELAKNLGNLPPNVCTPSHLASEARRIAAGDERLRVKVLQEKDMARLKMGALLAVARGSRQPPQLIELAWNGGRRNAAPLVLVGKGITFDSGGISIKPAAAMDEMKYDMCGAASVLGAIAAIAQLKLPINVVALVPTCENLPDGNATKPGDVVTTLSGKTVEILNTDAEGRLILCDTLTYGERFKPAAVVDVATLTGACVIALGKHAAGLLGNDADLVGELRQAGEDTGDRAWELPLWDDYQEQLKSNFADMSNVGGREAGTITAACFLARFAEKYPWAHLDIAGVAWRSGNAKGATGRPVPLLVEFLMKRGKRH